MLTLHQLTGFLLAAVLITATPGPDNLMVLGMGISKGRKQGIAFGMGCALGCLSHTFLAAVGVSALIAASPTAFTLLKIAGGIYLIYLGANAIRKAGAVAVTNRRFEETTLRRLFFKGCFANAINPKVVLFFLSFLPQFVVPGNGSVGLQLAGLGIAFTIQAAILFSLLGYYSGAIGQWLKRKPTAGAILDRIAGTVFILLGLRLIVTR